MIEFNAGNINYSDPNFTYDGNFSICYQANAFPGIYRLQSLTDTTMIYNGTISYNDIGQIYAGAKKGDCSGKVIIID